MAGGTLRSIVENEITQGADDVWSLKDHAAFGYSDGRASDQYLAHVFSRARDLGSRSDELRAYIRDWPSEYHLSAKRSQLLSGFGFDRSAKVLEVGCGCGAITRHLGERFDEVVSVEGNPVRARLARARTRDLAGVSILCAPFQDVRFTRKFDIIICVGVFEYSGSFVHGENPYETVLRYFDELLTPDGVVVIAIENQFGLKYFNGLREDHVGAPFVGLEGYPAANKGVRTFGRSELQQLLERRFAAVRFYYPYPDYKLPDCVADEEFLLDARAGELVSQYRSRDYGGPVRPLWDERLVTLELARNRLLPHLAHSFLVLAGKRSLDHVRFGQKAIFYSSGRLSRFATETRVERADDGKWFANKRGLAGETVWAGPVRLRSVKTEWVGGHSLHVGLARACRRDGQDLVAMFAAAKPWVAYLRSQLSGDALLLPGGFIDCIWSNTFVRDGSCTFVDREWEWHEAIPLPVLVARAIYRFLDKLDASVAGLGSARALRARNGRTLIKSIGAAIGVQIDDADLRRFVALESMFQSTVFGGTSRRRETEIRWFLLDRPTLNSARRGVRVWREARRRLTRGLAAIGLSRVDEQVPVSPN